MSQGRPGGPGSCSDGPHVSARGGGGLESVLGFRVPLARGQTNVVSPLWQTWRVATPRTGRERGGDEQWRWRQVRAGTSPWFATPAAREVAAALAGLAGHGLLYLGKLPDGVPLSWQLIRGAAVAQPEVGSSPKFRDLQALRP